MSTNIECEELDTVTLVRMEDVQPARERSSDGSDKNLRASEAIDYDDDSNIGSNVSIQSEEASGPREDVSMTNEDDSSQQDDDDDDDEDDDDDDDEDSKDSKTSKDSNSEMIIPEVVKPHAVFVSVVQPKKEKVPESWPTLEILPGGVIKRSEFHEKTDNPEPIHPKEEVITPKVEVVIHPKEEVIDPNEKPPGEKMYACAKCSKSFKYLYCLVKHVRWHEKQQKSQDMSKMSDIEKEMVHIKKARFELEKSYKKEKVDVLARIAVALSKIENFEDILK